MKKNCLKMLLMVFATGLLANNLFAQGAYVNINVGYGIGMSMQNVPGFYNSTSNGSSSNSLEQVNVSLGKGLNAGCAFGYMFTKNVGAELGISYLFGGKSKETDTYSGGTTDYTLSAKMLRINPSLVITPGFDNINPYAKFGLVIGAGSIMYESNENDNGDITVEKQKLNGGMAFGLSSAVGIMCNLNDQMSLFAELNMVNLSYAPTTGKYTVATYNGVDELPNMTTKQKETDYMNSYTETSTSSPDSQPEQALKEKFPFGSFGVNVGIKINFK